MDCAPARAIVPDMSVPEFVARPAFLAALGLRRVLLAVAAATLLAALLNPVFVTPFPVLVGRTLFIAVVLLVVHAAAARWPTGGLPDWMPRWLAQALAVALAAPLATFAVYLLSVGGDVMAFVRTPGRVLGYLWIAGSALVIGLVLTLGARVCEREAQARSQALQFALERETLERQALDARLSLLQAQIEPHFLFNTLANVQALVEGGSPRAAEVLKSLIDYLRAAMPRLHDGEATLGRELALVRAYLALMQMRMPDRLQFDLQVAPALEGRRLPAMALLTLVENAVHHGIDPGEAGGRVEVGADTLADGWRVWVADTGPGMHAQAQPGAGLTNLQARLTAYFGSAARLQLSDQSPSGLRVEILLPQEAPR